MKLAMRLLGLGSTAAALLFGMIFCLSVTHFAGFVWRQSWTMVFYGILLGWVAVHVWTQRFRLRHLVLIDVLFILFVVALLFSLLPASAHDPVAAKFGRYLPFMAVVPYVCGRLMGTRDVRHLAGTTAAGGMVMLALVAIDLFRNFDSYAQHGRWPFFGYDHSALLIGILLALTLVSLTYRFLTMGSAISWSGRQLIVLAATWLVAVAMVFVAARGALISGAVAVLCLALISRARAAPSRVFFVAALAAVVTVAFMMLPRPQAQFYANLLTKPDSALVDMSPFRAEADSAPVGMPHSGADAFRRGGARAEALEQRPILGTDSCKPFEEGVNSVAMRWVLYREALAIFLDRPWFGVGAAGFGRFSCTGVAGFPHSTVLQALAELGIVGGGLFYIGLLLSAFVRLGRSAMDRARGRRSQVAEYALATFVTCVIADQLYGNYFMAAGSYLMIGIAAGMRAEPADDKGSTGDRP